jgi:hypothetical protein
MRWVPPLHFRYPPPVHFLPYLHALHVCHHTACMPTDHGARVTLTRGRLVKAATAEAETEDAFAKLAEEKKRCMTLHFRIADCVWAAVICAMSLEATKLPLLRCVTRDPGARMRCCPSRTACRSAVSRAAAAFRVKFLNPLQAEVLNLKSQVCGLWFLWSSVPDLPIIYLRIIFMHIFGNLSNAFRSCARFRAQSLRAAAAADACLSSCSERAGGRDGGVLGGLGKRIRSGWKCRGSWIRCR